MNYLKFIIILLVIPIAAFLVSLYYESAINHNIQEQLAAEYKEIDSSIIKKITVESIILNPKTSRKVSFEFDVYLFILMKFASIGVMGLVLVFLSVIIIFSRIGLKDRKMLINIFRPTVLTAQILVSIITLANSLLLVGALYYGESALLGVVHFIIIGAIGLGGFIGAVMMIDAILSFSKQTPLYIKDEIISQDNPLYNEIHMVADKLEIKMPDYVFLGVAPLFFVFEGQIMRFNKMLDGQIIYLAAAFIKKFSKDELRAIIIHELAHFLGDDLNYSNKFLKIYRSLSASLENLNNTQNMWMQIPRLPSIMLLNYLLEAFAVPEKKHARDREFIADQIAINNTGAMPWGRSLIKAALFMRIWQKAEEQGEIEVQTDKTERSQYEIVEVIFNNLLENNADEFKDTILETSIPHPLNSHPTISERLKKANLNPTELLAAITF